MSTVEDRNVVDLVSLEDGALNLIITDNLLWGFAERARHARILQDKLNDYLNFIGSGQLEELYDKSKYDRIVIKIIAEHPYSRYGIDFLERAKTFIGKSGLDCDLEWTHIFKDGAENEFDDGFCDDYVFDAEKIYPRLKYNYSQNPLETVKLMMTDSNFEVGESEGELTGRVPMTRCWDSYVMMFIQDVGSTYKVINYDDMPEGMTVEELEKKAFDNLLRDVSYRLAESSVHPGVWGIIAGGNFEAESLRLLIWREISDKLGGGDLIIAVPTKDMVMFVPEGKPKLIKKLKRMAHDTMERNLKESPELIFTKDMFRYDRASDSIEVTGKKIC